MEALKLTNKVIGSQNDGRAACVFIHPNTGYQRVLNFMRNPKLAHILVHLFEIVGNLTKTTVD